MAPRQTLHPKTKDLKTKDLKTKDLKTKDLEKDLKTKDFEKDLKTKDQLKEKNSMIDLRIEDISIIEMYYTVTKLSHLYFGEFNPDLVIQKMMASPKWPSSPYYGKTVEEIKTQWKTAGEESAKQGTKMHTHIENYYRHNTPWNDDTIECKNFNQFLKDNVLTPFAFEMRVKLQYGKAIISGIIDAVFLDSAYNLVLVDWKRCKDIKMDNSFENGTEFLSHLPNCNYIHYSLQLGIYKRIIQMTHKDQVSDLYIINFSDPTGYQKIPAKPLEDEVTNILESIKNK